MGLERRHARRCLRRTRWLCGNTHVADPTASEATTSPAQTLHPYCTEDKDDDDDQEGRQCNPHAGDMELDKRVGGALDLRGVDIGLEN